LPAGVTPVSKQLFINLLDPDLNLAATIPEKIEGWRGAPIYLTEDMCFMSLAITI